MAGRNRLRHGGYLGMGGALLALGASACSGSSGPAGRDRLPSKNTAPLVIGASLSLTGDFADPGKAVQRGYELWAASVNAKGGLLGRKVEFKIVDDTSSPEPGRDQLPEPHQARTRSTWSSAPSPAC